MCAGQFKTTRHRPSPTINGKEIPKRAEAWKHKHEEQPEPFLPPNRVDDHPNLEDEERQGNRRSQKKFRVLDIFQERAHAARLDENKLAGKRRYLFYARVEQQHRSGRIITPASKESR